MADGRNFDNGFIDLSRESSDFNEIWCRPTDADFYSKNDHVTKNQNFAN